MTDRELLELAAKAAGIKALQRSSGYWTIEVHERGMRGWNPLIDDGDALRLAVKLGMHNVDAFPVPTLHLLNECGGDPYSATRRAIVRAAAAIGEKMP